MTEEKQPEEMNVNAEAQVQETTNAQPDEKVVLQQGEETAKSDASSQAQNAANNMRLTSQLAGSSSIKVETIEQSWQTIMDGIKDTQAIQVELAKQRQQDKARIEEVNRKFLQQIQQR